MVEKSAVPTIWQLDNEDYLKYKAMGLIQDASTSMFPQGNTMGSILGGTRIMENKEDYMKLLAMRMRWLPSQNMPFPHLSIHVGATKAFVFVVNTDGNAVTLEDSADLFPSDGLITQIRLLLG